MKTNKEEMQIEQPCYFLKRNFDLGYCPNYGSSDCPITMHENEKCYLSKEYLIDILQYSGLEHQFDWGLT